MQTMQDEPVNCLGAIEVREINVDPDKARHVAWKWDPALSDSPISG